MLTFIKGWHSTCYAFRGLTSPERGLALSFHQSFSVQQLQTAFIIVWSRRHSDSGTGKLRTSGFRQLQTAHIIVRSRRRSDSVFANYVH